MGERNGTDDIRSLSDKSLWGVLCLLLSLSSCPSFSEAGGGPENVLLVVNINSDDSKRIANHYAQLRDIPASNIVGINWQSSVEACGVERFRENLLKPMFAAIEARKLAPQIDYIVYSADFPWKVNLKPDYPEHQYSRAAVPTASLTGATYLWPFVAQKSPSIAAPATNLYVPGANGGNLNRCTTLDTSATRAFRSRYFWAPDGKRVEDRDKGQYYVLSMMLGVTSGRGNTADEVIAYLNRSVAADRTYPQGTFYFMKNDDIRSKIRHGCYQAAADALEAEGGQAKILSGVAPKGVSDIMGLMTGNRTCDLAAAGSRVMPGAFCDHLTSYGGILAEKSPHMPLTDFLRQGAAGASGTVFEPLGLQAKFPLPMIHVHYRRGCSLAEAFYQSVLSPYQLLVVGDPLCQPWAKPPPLVVQGVEPGQSVSGVLKVTPIVNPGKLMASRKCELFFDGVLRARVANGKPVTLNTTAIPEGWHELRMVAASVDAIEAQMHVVKPFIVDNWPGTELSLEPVGAAGDWSPIELLAQYDLSPQLAATLGEPAEGLKSEGLEESKESKGLEGLEEPKKEAVMGSLLPAGCEIVLLHNRREIGRKAVGDELAGEVRFRVDRSQTGSGPVRLDAHLVQPATAGKPKVFAGAEPLWIDMR